MGKRDDETAKLFGWKPWPLSDPFLGPPAPASVARRPADPEESAHQLRDAERLKQGMQRLQRGLEALNQAEEVIDKAKRGPTG